MADSSHLRDSLLYGPNWAVEPVRSWFTESRRIASWLGILAAVAQAQAHIGAIPRAAADRVAQACAHGGLDLDGVAERLCPPGGPGRPGPALGIGP